MKSTTQRKLKNEKGFATIEATLLLVVFVVLVSYGIGMFGIIHSGIMNSISARTYAWETYAQRSNVVIFRSNPGATGVAHYAKAGFRAHGVISEDEREQTWGATERPISFLPADFVGRTGGTHGNLGVDLTKRGRNRQGVNPVWIRIVYGICLDVQCGGVQL